MVLHPLRSELNFPIGGKFDIPMTSATDEGARYEFVLHLMEALFYSDTTGGSFALQQLKIVERPSKVSANELSGLWTLDGCRNVLHDLSKAIQIGISKLSLSVMPQTEKGGQRQLLLLNNEYYHTHLIQHFARWSLIYLVRHVHVKDALAVAGDELSELIDAPLDAAEFRTAFRWRRADELVFNYILNKGDQEQFEETFGSRADMIRLLNLAKAWLVSFLPHCVSKRCRVDYGLLGLADLLRWKKLEREATRGDSNDDNDEFDVFKRFEQPASRRGLVVPFEAKDVPSRSSEFASPEILIGLSILAYRYCGLRVYDVVTVVETLQKSLAAELGPVEKRLSRVQFDEWKHADASGWARTQRTHGSTHPRTHAPTHTVRACFRATVRACYRARTHARTHAR